MWAAWVVAAIALAGAGFMLRFLIAILREGAPSVCYWVAPACQAPEKTQHLDVLRGIYFDETCSAAEIDRSAHYLDLLENDNYAKEECDSGLIALDVPPASARVGWRSIDPSRGFVFRERRL
jgi:hypothetical protein